MGAVAMVPDVAAEDGAIALLDIGLIVLAVGAAAGELDALLALQAVHEILRLYVNFFQPVRKLVSKERHGARVLKRYDRAQTPYRRLLASGILTPPRRDALVAEYHRLNPLQLRAELAARLDALWKLADRSERSAA